MSSRSQNILAICASFKSEIEVVSSNLGLTITEVDRLVRIVSGHTNINIGRVFYGVVNALCIDNIARVSRNDRHLFEYLRFKYNNVNISRLQLAVLNFLLCMDDLRHYGDVVNKLKSLDNDTSSDHLKNVIYDFERRLREYRHSKLADVAFLPYYKKLRHSIENCSGQLADRSSLEIWNFISNDPTTEKWIKHETLLKDLMAYEINNELILNSHDKNIDHVNGITIYNQYDSTNELIQDLEIIRGSQLKLLSDTQIAKMMDILTMGKYFKKWACSYIRNSGIAPRQNILIQMKREGKPITYKYIENDMRNFCEPLINYLEKTQLKIKVVLEFYIAAIELGAMPLKKREDITSELNKIMPPELRRRKIVVDLGAGVFFKEVHDIKDSLSNVLLFINECIDIINNKKSTLSNFRDEDVSMISDTFSALYCSRSNCNG